MSNKNLNDVRHIGSTAVWAMHEYNLLQNRFQAIRVTFIQKTL